MCSILILVSKRLQVVLSEKELDALRVAAKRQGLTLSEWARGVLRRARERQLGPSPETKLEALDRALQCGHPTADIEQMLDDIDEGRDLR